jgi:hypothetical protein
MVHWSSWGGIRGYDWDRGVFFLGNARGRAIEASGPVDDEVLGKPSGSAGVFAFKLCTEGYY